MNRMVPSLSSLSSLSSLLLLSSLAFPLVATTAACNGNCQEVVSSSDTSSGTFTLTTGEAASNGSVAGQSGLSVSGGASNTVTIEGSFNDTSGTAHTFQLTIVGVVNDQNVPFGSGSQACIDDYSSCGAVSGSLSASLYSQNCTSNGCALTLTGVLQATTTFPVGTLDLQLAIAHQDSWEQGVCSNQTDGS